jgi:hypothetical protein
MKHEYTDAELQAAALSQLRPLAEAGEVPEGCVRVTGWLEDEDWILGSFTNKKDTHFVDVQLPAAKADEPTPEPLVAEHKALTADEWAARWQAEVDARNRQYNELECTRAIAEKALTKLAKTKENGLSQLRPLAEADDVPEGCVRHYTYKQDGEWTPATKHRAMQVTHYIDIPHLPAPPNAPKPSYEPSPFGLKNENIPIPRR